MSLRFKGGDWEPMLLGIEPRTCRVCGKGLYRNVTLLRGGWSRCSICNEFVHYSCLASGRVKFLKQRPRVCQCCRAELLLTSCLIPCASGVVALIGLARLGP